MASEQMEVDGGEDRTRRGTSVISIDDLEAAQALEGLRSDTTQSPASEQSQPEPLLSLLTSTHPILSSAINGSVSMYTSSKSYSPRFRYGAEFLERNIGSPVVNTVGTVGRKTGVEGGLRWALLQRREPTPRGGAIPSNDPNAPAAQDAEQQQQPQADAMDIEKGRPSLTRRSSGFSTDTLPPYDHFSSPAYEESAALLDSKRETGSERTSGPASTWKGRLVISTSGLGVAMSEESLRSLTYCLTWLKWANSRLGNAVIALKRVLQEWESVRDGSAAAELGPENRSRSPTVVAQQIQQLKADVLQTLKQVVDIVSKYAGGALPENARNLVRRHLTSLPRRFRIASTSNQPPTDSSVPQSDVSTNARRALVLAEEGLDMMAQVSGIVNDTLVSAEEWCDRLRRPRPSTNSAPNGAQEGMPPQQLPPLDVKLPIPQQQDDVEMTEGS